MNADPSDSRVKRGSLRERLGQNEIVRHALNNRWLEEQGVPDVNAPPR